MYTVGYLDLVDIIADLNYKTKKVFKRFNIVGARFTQLIL